MFQNPYGSLNPRQKIGTALEEPLLVNTDAAAAERARQAARDMMREVGLRPEYYRPLSAHVLGRPAPAHRHRPRADAATRKSWCSTSRCRRSTFRSARRCSTCWPTCRKSSASPTCSSSHDLSVVRHIADEVMVMYLGHVVEIGAARRCCSPPRSIPIRARCCRRRRSPIPARQARAHHPERRAALAVRSAARLRLPSALPARVRRLPRREAAAGAQARARRSPAGR